MKLSLAKINQVLDSGSKDEKIQLLESLSNVSDRKIVNKMISTLDDPEIEVRGEAFSSLVLNKNDIAKMLIDCLNSESKNVRGFSALILANRKDSEAIPSILNLTKDEISMVRSCALGALGYLRAEEAKNAIHNCLLDSDMEVKKSALKAAIDIGEKILPEEIKEISKEKDVELEKLIIQAQQS